MFLTIGNVLSEENWSELEGVVPALTWRDGAETAGAVARQVKKNEQADLTSRSGVKLRDLLFEAISQNLILRAYARPEKFSKFLISRTGIGGGYGLHVDNPQMFHNGEKLRTDLSFTLFLNEPSEYEGGDLTIELSGITHRVKGQKGDLVIYPSSTLHGVEQVISGERLVCVGWIQSEIRSAEQRELLFDLENLKAELSRSHDANSQEMLILSKTMANLKRMWMG